MAQIAREKKSTVKKVAYEKKQEEGGKFHFHRSINERTGDRAQVLGP